MTDLMTFKSFQYFDREVNVSFVAAVGKEHKGSLSETELEWSLATSQEEVDL